MHAHGSSQPGPQVMHNVGRTEKGRQAVAPNPEQSFNYSLYKASDCGEAVFASIAEHGVPILMDKRLAGADRTARCGNTNEPRAQDSAWLDSSTRSD